MRSVWFFIICFLLAGCDVFNTRTPEAPDGSGSSWIQPDTPEQVVDNLKTAIAEMNTQNYLRSLAETLTFEPTTPAAAQDPLLWNTWARTEEQTYIERLRAATAQQTGHRLELFDENRSVPQNDVYLLDATYLLTANHSRVDEAIPTEVQGKLFWEITLGSDGLWRLSKWVDQSLGDHPSWSDLKVAFVK